MKTPHRDSLTVVFVAFGLLFALAYGQAQVLPPGTVVLTETDNGTTVRAFVGQMIEVDLHGNVSTGFAWGLASATGDSVQTNGVMTYTVDPGGGVGVGGMFGFPFLAAKPGETALAFEYRRAGDTNALQNFAVAIQVTTAPPLLSLKWVKPNIVISWPMAGSTNFFLEGATSLEPWQWAALNVLPLPDGTNYTVTLGTSGNALYFRLRQPKA